jgi:lipoprotein-anchoring transpeptidase ErfK/SrfK
MTRKTATTHRAKAVAATAITSALVLGACASPLSLASARTDGEPEPTATVSYNPAPTTVLGVEHVSPSSATYGVGIVVKVTFDHDVPKAARDAVTSKITVTSTKDIGEAGWAWSDSRTAIYRPKEFWPAHSTVTITANPTHDLLGHYGSEDLRWGGSIDREFATGYEQVIKVDDATHQATVVRGGDTIRTMPVSLGMPGWETRSGVKVLMEKYEVKRMTSGSIGAEEEYELDVPYAIRLTNSGEFIHAAPWATGRLGRYDGSHGCTNLSMSDAKWLYYNHQYGDPVVTTGTNRQMTGDNGAGGPWNVSWATWQKGSAS